MKQCTKECVGAKIGSQASSRWSLEIDEEDRVRLQEQAGVNCSEWPVSDLNRRSIWREFRGEAGSH